MSYKKQSDKFHEIKLDSKIMSVYWKQKMATGGGTVSFFVQTHFVGNGSTLKIELIDQSGKTFGKYEEKISGNRFWAQVQVPADAKDALYANIKMPKHGLEMKSNPLIILPPIEIENLKWDKKEARRGDVLKMTADVKGAPDGTEAEIEIWEHDADGVHDLITKFPVLVKNSKVEAKWEFEYHEDTDEIPTEEESEKGYNPPEYFFRIRVGEVISDSDLLEFKDWIVIRLKDLDGSPIPDADFILHLPDGSEKKGKLDSDGYSKVENIPPGKFLVEFPNTPGVTSST
jgi:hypothetical protein